jgi:hypothetical protein
MKTRFAALAARALPAGFARAGDIDDAHQVGKARGMPALPAQTGIGAG